MGLFSRLWKAITVPASVVLHTAFRTLQWGMSTERIKAKKLLDHYKHWVYVCATKNANAIASNPLRLYVTTGYGEKQYRYLRKGRDTRKVDRKQMNYLKGKSNLTQILTKAVDVEEVIEHPFLDLMRTINPWHNGYDTLELLQIFLEVTGNAYLYVWDGGNGIPTELWILPSQDVIIVPDKETFIRGYLYGKGKHNAVALTPEEVIHFKFPNPTNLFYGYSPLEACWKAVSRKEGYDEYEESLLKNNARPDFAISVKNRMNQTDKLSLREQFQQMFGTRRGRGKPIVLDNDAKIDTFGFSPKDMAYTKGRKLTREEILAAYGVPVSKVTVENVNRANAESGDYQYAKDTVLPRGRRVEDKLNEKLLPRFDPRLFVAFDNPVPEDEKFKLDKQTAQLSSQVITINEAREEEGMLPVPWGHVPLVNFNIVPLGTPSPAALTPEEEAALSEEPEGEEVTTVATLPARKQAAPINQPPQPEIPVMRTIMQVIYRQIHKEVLRNMAQAAKSVRRGRIKQPEPTVQWFFFDVQKWIKKVGKKMSAPIKRQLARGGKWGMQAIGEAASSFDVMNIEIQNWMKTYVAHFANVTTRDMSKLFNTEMLRGLEAGESIPELTSRVNNFFENTLEKHKAETIARSESSRASHHGLVESWKQSEVVTAKIWDAQSDACPFCEALEGTVVSLESNFFEQGSSMTVTGREGQKLTLNFGYEPVLSPPLHPNCVCSLQAVVKE